MSQEDPGACGHHQGSAWVSREDPGTCGHRLGTRGFCLTGSLGARVQVHEHPHQPDHLEFLHKCRIPSGEECILRRPVVPWKIQESVGAQDVVVAWNVAGAGNVSGARNVVGRWGSPEPPGILDTSGVSLPDDFCAFLFLDASVTSTLTETRHTFIPRLRNKKCALLLSLSLGVNGP